MHQRHIETRAIACQSWTKMTWELNQKYKNIFGMSLIIPDKTETWKEKKRKRRGEVCIQYKEEKKQSQKKVSSMLKPQIFYSVIHNI